MSIETYGREDRSQRVLILVNAMCGSVTDKGHAV